MFFATSGLMGDELRTQWHLEVSVWLNGEKQRRSLRQSLSLGERSMSTNTTQIRAAVVREKGGPFSIETLSLEGPRRDEVLVKVVATGLWHTDMVARDKGYPRPPPH